MSAWRTLAHACVTGRHMQCVNPALRASAPWTDRWWRPVMTPSGESSSRPMVIGAEPVMRSDSWYPSD
jgi:hypothetical protein